MIEGKPRGPSWGPSKERHTLVGFLVDAVDSALRRDKRPDDCKNSWDPQSEHQTRCLEHVSLDGIVSGQRANPERGPLELEPVL